MSGEACRVALEAAPINQRAEHLDKAFPQCACEPWSLTEVGGDGIASDELIARVLTSPDAYDETTSTLLTSKLTQLYAMGMSTIRQGCSDAEIKHTVTTLVDGAAEPRKLIGAIVLPAQKFRDYANDDDAARWFGVYATDDSGKLHHADVFGTKASKGQQQKRRYRLAEEVQPFLVKAADPDELLTKLREAGI